MKELLDAFRSIYGGLATDGPNAASELLAVPNPYETARGAFPTSGDFVVYLLTGHMSYHLGQLSGWRAAARSSLP